MDSNLDELQHLDSLLSRLLPHKTFVISISQRLGHQPTRETDIPRDDIRFGQELEILRLANGQVLPEEGLVGEILTAIRTVAQIKDDDETNIAQFLSHNHATSIHISVVANNFFQVDLLAALLKAPTREFWTLFHNVCRALKFLWLTKEQLANTLQEILKKIAGDYSGGEIYPALSNLAYCRPDLASETIELIFHQAKMDACSFVSSLCEGIGNRLGADSLLAAAHPFLASPNLEMQRIGILSISLCRQEPIPDGIPKILDQKLTEGDVTLLPAIAQAYGNLLNLLPFSKEKLISISKTEDPQTLFVLGHVLAMHRLKHSEPWYSELLFELSKTKPEPRGALNQLSHLLFDMVADHPDVIHEFLNKWLLFEHNKPSDIHAFDHLIEHWYSQNKERFHRLVTLWLVSEDLKFQIALSEILNHFFVNGKKIIELDKSTIASFSFESFEVAIMRTLGFVLHKDHLETMLYSILRGCGESEKVRGLIVSAFVSYVVYNYPSVIVFLKTKEKTASNFEKVAITEITRYWDSYTKELSRVGVLDELKGSEERLEAFWKLQSKKFNQGMQERDENSIFSMVKKIDLKCGGRWFMKTPEGYSEKSRLGVISSDMEMPRGEYIDPLGQAKLRFFWKTFHHQ